MVATSRLILFGLLLISIGWGALAGNSPLPVEKPATQSMLTAEERAYLAHKGPLRFCVQPDWLPFQRINEQGKHEGIAEDMLQLMSNRLGLTFEPKNRI
jgi:hypothetical protein